MVMRTFGDLGDRLADAKAKHYLEEDNGNSWIVVLASSYHTLDRLAK